MIGDKSLNIRSNICSLSFGHTGKYFKTTIITVIKNELSIVFLDCSFFSQKQFVQSVRAVEYIVCTSTDSHPHNECPGYDTKQSDGEVPVMQELWGMRSTSSLPSLPGPLWPGVVAPDSDLFKYKV